MNSNSRFHFRPVRDAAGTPALRISRAEFSPITLRSRLGARLNVSVPRVDEAPFTLDARDAAQTDFLRRWPQSDFLFRAEPSLTRYRE